jgi:fructose-1,6-bisphosphatase II / sedoheptulose-1,7-bisphosphatase
MGIGAAPEGVISAAAMRCVDGHFQGQLIYDPEIVKTGLIGESKEKNLERLTSMGITDPDRVYNADELASGENVLFAACGITPGVLMWCADSKLGHLQPVPHGALCGHHSPIR